MTRSFAVAAVTGTALTLAALSPAPVQAGMVGIATTGPASAQADANLIEKVGRRGRRGVAIGAGIVTLGVLGAIAASRARERDYDRYDYEDRRYRYRDNCRRWRRWCRRGDDRACWKFDSRC